LYFGVQNAWPTFIRICKNNSLDLFVDLEAQPLFIRKICNVNNAAKYQKRYAAIEPFLIEMSISYMVEADVSHANAFLKQRNRQNSEECGDL